MTGAAPYFRTCDVWHPADRRHQRTPSPVMVMVMVMVVMINRHALTMIMMAIEGPFAVV